VKSDRGHASHYYSQPAFRAEGRLTLDGREVAVTGQAWLDREWSSQPLDADQTGWDWFSLSLDDGTRLMLYHLRMADGRRARTVGTHVAPDGRVTPLDGGGIVMAPTGYADVRGRETPVRWRIEVPDFGIALDTRPLNAQSWNDLGVPYWEGPVFVEGSHRGRGYLEMTGY
jgi:predicted secreted hydrolase